MKKMKKEEGFVVSTELLLIVTILVIGLVVGLVAVRNAVLAELGDVAEAIGELDQSYQFMGTQELTNANVMSSTEGSSFNDQVDNFLTGNGGIEAGDLSPISVLVAPGANEGTHTTTLVTP